MNTMRPPVRIFMQLCVRMLNKNKGWELAEGCVANSSIFCMGMYPRQNVNHLQIHIWAAHVSIHGSATLLGRWIHSSANRELEIKLTKLHRSCWHANHICKVQYDKHNHKSRPCHMLKMAKVLTLTLFLSILEKGNFKGTVQNMYLKNSTKI